MTTRPPARPRRTVEVGRVTVHLDSHNNPWKFTRRDGVEVECICQDGIRCQFHLRAMAEKARPAGTTR